MKNNNDAEEVKKYHKIKLFEDIPKITKYFPEIESHFRTKNNLENLNDEKLKLYIDILYQKYPDYEKINYFEKRQLIKTQTLLQIFKFNNYHNNKALDLILLKELQLEKEKNQNKSKKKLKKPLSADYNKLGKNNKNNNLKNDSNKSKKNKINNYHPLEDLKIKNTFYHQNIKGNKNININIEEKNNAIQIIEKLNNGILIWIDDNYNNLEIVHI